MTWNYRIIRHDQDNPEWYGLHEVYYNEAGAVEGWTEDSIDFVGDSAEDLTRSIEMALSDARHHAVLVESQTIKLGFGVGLEDDEEDA